MKIKFHLVPMCLFWALLLTFSTKLPAQNASPFQGTDNGDGTCTLSGYTGPGGAVVIPSEIPILVGYNSTNSTAIYDDEPVDAIGYEAFNSDTNITSITIPYGVTRIELGAFIACFGLATISIPDSVTSIEQDAFQDCSNLTSLTIPDSVTSLGVDAVYGCSGLTTVVIGNGITSIPDTVFDLLPALSTVTFGTNVTSIAESAFIGCPSLAHLTFPNSLTSIGASAFQDCPSLTSITIPDGVASIAADTFFQCSNLTSVTISEGVTTIGEGAFFECTSLPGITIPASVTNIGEAAFAYCYSLKYACFEGEPPRDGGFIFGQKSFGKDPLTVIDHVKTATGWKATYDDIKTAPCAACSGAEGSLQITITPPAAVKAGAEWRVNGGAWHASGATVGNLDAGDLTVSFKAISGWAARESQSVFVAPGQTTSLSVTYEDDSKPVVAITSPTANQRVKTSTFTVKGTASDNWQVAGVMVQLNGGGWYYAAGTTKWSATLTLAPGSNVVQAYAVDPSGTQSAIKQVNFDSVVAN